LVVDTEVFSDWDPFKKIEYYQFKYNQDFFESFHGEDWKGLSQEGQFPACYGDNWVITF
jgi:hypothetical protein